ncbi:hypothetical protein [Colwellia sp. RSH04]|uniref:hypothetical protein n=1 Tax=Colwellia sp. RSH04 TaxID=2305464 RepID=UPI000E595AD2|nr:hypothetical protein [Colwellia sp. RSH04]RHW77802.1 hypothetical protein D1094_02430 [Colwellia sp. RSH04]
MNRTTSLVTKIASLTLLISASAIAEDATTSEDGLADMSDPLAVFTMAGAGITNKGINLKVAKSYDTGVDDKLGMNLFELKGIYGDTLGWEDNANNSIDSIRVRNLTVNPNTGLGAQIDLSYDFNSESGTLSYSLLQALPQMGRFNLYPLAGIGVAVANNTLQDDGSIASGYSFPGTFATVGLYGKFTVTDQIWLNYNPIWNTSLSGSTLFKDHGFENHSSVLMHEFIVSYQINPRSNIRYFANWSQHTDFSDGDQRIEYNYQF